MLTSLALIFLVSLLISKIMKIIKVPSLLGFLITGILLGPYVFNLLDESILNISADLRKISLVIILTRAGLSLSVSDLKQVGKSAILMCFVPALFEISAMVIIAPILFNINILEAAIMGAVVSAVSPAVVVPKMINLIDKKVGTKQSIPQMIIAGASVDDIFVIVLFSSFLGMSQGREFSFLSLLQVPLAVISGGLFGFVLGHILNFVFNKIQTKEAVKILIILSFSFLLLKLENVLDEKLAFSSLLAIMSSGIVIKRKNEELGKKLASKFSELWVGAEILLFSLVGAVVNINYVQSAGLKVVVLIFMVVLFRMLGVFISLLKSNLNTKERFFCMIAYSPKATVQAAIGSIPLSMGLACGNIVLTGAVMSILITAPIGAFFIDYFANKFLEKNIM